MLAGKTTLLRMIAGLEAVTEGKILFDGILTLETSPASKLVSCKLTLRSLRTLYGAAAS